MKGFRPAANLPQESAPGNDSVSATAIRPFLRWAGGKFHLAAMLCEFVPDDIQMRRYFEPFFGAGSLFFSLQHPKAFLSDANSHLMECYREVRDHSISVARHLRGHQSKDCEDYYYVVRDAYNRSPPGTARAARFIYLNRTGFNGVFRVNRSGRYNVPYGRKKSARFPTPAELDGAAALLRTARLRDCDYLKALRSARAEDFIYLDPPYPPLNGTSFFTHYTTDRFDIDNQAKVAACVKELHKRGCLVMISNADTREIRSLYKGFSIQSLSVRRFVTSSSIKHSVDEVIITNY